MTQIAPGDAPERGSEAGIAGYVIGLVLAGGLTFISFYITRGGLFWPPSIPTALIVLAIAQMGVHLVFFLHVTSGRIPVDHGEPQPQYAAHGPDHEDAALSKV